MEYLNFIRVSIRLHKFLQVLNSNYKDGLDRRKEWHP